MSTETNNTTELKPCPFCGGKAEHSPRIDNPQMLCESVHCRPCKLMLYTESSKESVIEKWNNQKPLSDSLRLVKELQSKIAYLRANERCWISCGERLPDSDRMVIGWIPETGQSEPTFYRNEKWRNQYASPFLSEITQWQEWPKDPEPSAEKKRK